MATKVQVQRGERLLDLTVTPTPSSKLNGGGTLGIRLAANVERVDHNKPEDLASLVAASNKEFARVFRDTASGLTTFVTGRAAQSGETLAGPVGMIRMGAEAAAADSGGLLSFAAALSINLAIINALPLPALDGGQLLFVLIEIIRRKPMDIRVQESITAGAILVLILLSATATFDDFTVLPNFLHPVLQGP
uniref:Peptidase M50 domain-containing protein n=1 Tax=Rhizochromulina marina TaxID=1034831 RepID=A0A7S2RK06_9STRA